MLIDERKKQKSGNAEPRADKSEGLYRGGEKKTPASTAYPEDRGG